MSNEASDFLMGQVTLMLHARVSAEADAKTAAGVATLLAHARALHRAFDTEHLNPGTELLMELNPTGAISNWGDPITNLRNLVGSLPPGRDGLSILVLPNRTYRYEFRSVSQQVEPGYVKYIIRPFTQESVVTSLKVFEVESPVGLSSPFAMPYFRDLDSALQEYYVQRARQSTCLNLKKAWGDTNRFALSNRPEQHMRRSLHDYLSIRLRDAEPTVLQEQNVNETEPVDIRIQWLDTNRLTILEIKWLGDSLSGDGTAITTKYRDARAKEGYEQVRDYLIEQRLSLPGQIVRGRLIVFDARRSGITRASGSTTCIDPWSFESATIDYADVFDPDPGLDEPVRYFLEPGAPRAA